MNEMPCGVSIFMIMSLKDTLYAYIERLYLRWTKSLELTTIRLVGSLSTLLDLN